MPSTYERLKDDPEWNTKGWVFCRHIVGYFTMWAIRNLTGEKPFPPGLENMTGYLYVCIRPKFDNLGMAELSLCDINKMLHDTLMEEPIFKSWNDEKVLKEWLDLDALLHNVCLSIRDERRIKDEFGIKVEEKI